MRHTMFYTHLHAQSKPTVTFFSSPKQTFVLLEQPDKIKKKEKKIPSAGPYAT